MSVVDTFFSTSIRLVFRDDKGAHKLIARTEAKAKYMLKDCDLDLRKPVLRYISKKNPHNPRYGDMKLYLKAEVRLSLSCSKFFIRLKVLIGAVSADCREVCTVEEGAYANCIRGSFAQVFS